MTAPGPATDRGAAAPGGRVFLVGYYGVDNLGDEAIRWAIERAATTLGVEVVRYATRDARDTAARAVPIRLRAAPRYLAAIRAADRVVLGGGGILKDEGLRLPLELAVTALVARLLGRRVTLLGVGVGPFYSRVGRWLVRLTARLAQVRTVRDAASGTALADLGIGRVLVGADPIFTTDSGPDARRTVTTAPVPARATAPAAIDRASASPPAPAPLVVVSVRPWFHKESDQVAAEAARARLRGAVAAAVDALAGRGARVRSVSLYWPRDRDEAAELGGIPDAGRLDWPGLLAESGAADLVIAMRYHAVAATALTGRPTIALAYEPKVAELGAALGIPTLDVAAPDLREALLDAVRSWEAGTMSPPDAAAVDALRVAAWRTVRAALED